MHFVDWNFGFYMEFHRWTSIMEFFNSYFRIFKGSLAFFQDFLKSLKNPKTLNAIRNLKNYKNPTNLFWTF